MSHRIEKDSLGNVNVPSSALWGAQTQRASENFPHLGYPMPEAMIQALALVKKAAALANTELGDLDVALGQSIIQACDEILDGQHRDQFPLAVWQSGSGTQTNMNMNEVIANRANQLTGHPLGKKSPAHPNDHVNMSQSSNDVFPTAMHLATLSELEQKLTPALASLRDRLEAKSKDFGDLWKVGRTHMMDAAPVTLGQEFSGYVDQIDFGLQQLELVKPNLYKLAIGGTAVGTGLNTREGWEESVIKHLSVLSCFPLASARNKFTALSTHNTLLSVSSALRQVASDFLIIGSNLRMLASGPRAGLAEVILPANEPGSSIMPGKVNPTQIEALTMIAAEVMGNDLTVAIAASQGHLQLNLFKPIIINNILASIRLLAKGAIYFEKHCIKGLDCNRPQLARNLERSLMIVTALVPRLGYDKAAEVASYAQQHDLTIRQVLTKKKLMPVEEFDELIRQYVLTH